MKRHSHQQNFKFRTWGGAREGAGRKPQGETAGVSHGRRPSLPRRFPVHVTMRVRRDVYNLRSKRCFRPIERAFSAGKERFGFRLAHFSVQGNHLHLIVEAEDRRSLARGIQGLAIRIAKKLNRVMNGRRGKVFADRYHAHILRTPSEVKRALHYVLSNAEQHGLVKSTVSDPFASGLYLEVSLDMGGLPITRPETWLLLAAIRQLRRHKRTRLTAYR